MAENQTIVVKYNVSILTSTMVCGKTSFFYYLKWRYSIKHRVFLCSFVFKHSGTIIKHVVLLIIQPERANEMLVSGLMSCLQVNNLISIITCDWINRNRGSDKEAMLVHVQKTRLNELQTFSKKYIQHLCYNVFWGNNLLGLLPLVVP